MIVLFYVSQQGNDSWSGRLRKANPTGTDGPLRSLEAARDAIRGLVRVPVGGVTVIIGPGIYERLRPFRLTRRDGGTEASPIVYQGSGTRLIGGRMLEGFEPVMDGDVLGRLTPEARGRVVQMDLKARGILDYGKLSPRGFGRPSTPAHLELFFQGCRMQLARWPNDGFLRIDGPVEYLREGDGHGGKLGRLEAGFICREERATKWRSLEDVWVHGYWAWDWAETYEQVESIDPNTGHVKTLPPHGVYGIKAGQRFHFLNTLEELDRPGEYYMDRKGGALYFWPPAELETNEAAASILESPLIELDGASHVSFRNLSLEYGRASGARVIGGEHVSFVGCRIRGMGNDGLIVEGGRDHQVRGCEISHLGDCGVRVSGGDRRTLEPANHLIEGNHIHHMGEWSRCYRPGVIVDGVGISVRRNSIHDGPHSAVILSGNDNVVEYNHIHHVCWETGDVGAFYMGRDWTQRGNAVRYNLFHHTDGVGMGSLAVYLDDCSSGTTVFGNIFLGCSLAAFVGGGRDNRIENNIFVNCHPAVQIDGRGLDPSPVWHDMVYKTMKERLDAMQYRRPPYSLRYPEMAELDRYYDDDKGVPPEGNIVVRNVAWGGEWIKIHWHAEPSMVKVEDNLVGEDPGFVDLLGGDLRLREDSPAYALGFKRIPVELIGPEKQGRNEEGWLG